MRILYPNGVAPDQLDDALAIVRVMDKLFRIATSKNAFGENPWRDIAGYAILSVGRDENRWEYRLPTEEEVVKRAEKMLDEIRNMGGV